MSFGTTETWRMDSNCQSMNLILNFDLIKLQYSLVVEYIILLFNRTMIFFWKGFFHIFHNFFKDCQNVY